MLKSQKNVYFSLSKVKSRTKLYIHGINIVQNWWLQLHHSECLNYSDGELVRQQPPPPYCSDCRHHAVLTRSSCREQTAPLIPSCPNRHRKNRCASVTERKATASQSATGPRARVMHLQTGRQAHVLSPESPSRQKTHVAFSRSGKRQKESTNR